VSEPAVHPLKLASLLLQYPGEDLLASRGALVEAAESLPHGPQARALRKAAGHLARTDDEELRCAYVETFDFSRRATLHLTFHRFGDRRQRGMALLALKERYAAAGMPLADDAGELPDYLPLMLEFAALCPEHGLELLERHREAIELVRSALHAEGSPWAPALDAVALPLPGLTRTQAARIRRMASEGPPEEEVGLEPFAPPELMPGA
jgi:nitrate reductase delta subunit